MHDIDRTWSELGSDTGVGESEFEFDQETDFFQEMPFNEMQEMELAADLLSVSNEEELNYFLGSLIKKAGKAVGSFVSSPTGKALGGILKQAAKKALPVVGSAIGGYFGGSTGAKLGGKLASSAGSAFGLELEQDEQELEAARNFVKFAGSTVAKALQAPSGMPPGQAAKQAAAAAAKAHLPGLLGGTTTGSFGGKARSGKWYRRGGKVILVGL